jgi:biopolymer transport protein ExbD
VAVSLKDPQDGDIAKISDINVTPFIDVILVLLIILMVAAPLSTVDVPVELTVSNANRSRIFLSRSVTIRSRAKRCKRPRPTHCP